MDKSFPVTTGGKMDIKKRREMSILIYWFKIGYVSSFSSWGLGPDLSIKPDLSGPGGYIFST
jgi:hypothetical protein